MCKLNKHNDGRRIDICMRPLIRFLNNNLMNYKLRACCCGHHKYPISIIVSDLQNRYDIFDIISGERIKRYKRFYKKDKQGYYYIPEVVKNEQNR